jgi:hypothetical protein
MRRQRLSIFASYWGEDTRIINGGMSALPQTEVRLWVDLGHRAPPSGGSLGVMARPTRTSRQPGDANPEPEFKAILRSKKCAALCAQNVVFRRRQRRAMS